MAKVHKKITLLLLICIILLSNIAAQKTIIMLDPAGNARKKGRTLLHGYERGATLILAQTINKHLSRHELLLPLITRDAGEVHQPLYAASFANRINPALFVHVSIFKHTNPKPILFIYYRCTNRFTNFSHQLHNSLEFIPLQTTHLINIKNSERMARLLKKNLESQNSQKLLEINDPRGIPLQSLFGLVPPGIHLEIGIDDENKLSSLGIELANALVSSIFSSIER